MEKVRTGLLVESLENAKATGITHSAASETVRKKACTVTTVNITTDEDSKKLGREKGTYITVEMDKMCKITDADFESIIETIAKTIRSLITVRGDERILIVGLGNRDITPDSLGPKCIDKTIVTRGFENTFPELISEQGFSSVSAINANVFGVTGIESAELIKGISDQLDPALIIIIDALATASLARLCKTVQISNTSIIPGGGVDNSRKEISSDSVGANVITIGMPTVIDVNTLLSSCGFDQNEINTFLGDYSGSLIATTTTIGSETDTASKLIAFSLNKAFHFGMTTEDILKFLY